MATLWLDERAARDNVHLDFTKVFDLVNLFTTFKCYRIAPSFIKAAPA